MLSPSNGLYSMPEYTNNTGNRQDFRYCLYISSSFIILRRFLWEGLQADSCASSQS